MNKIFAAALISLAIPFAAASAAPTGFDAQTTATTRAPQGFDKVVPQGQTITIQQVLQNAKDDQIVFLEGKFTQRIGKEDYTFQDTKGDTITAELDDKYDWSHVAKDQPVRIKAKVDKEFRKTELDVIQVYPIK